MIPLPILLARTLPARYLILGLIAAIIDVSGMILSAIGQSLPVFGRIDFKVHKSSFPQVELLGFG